MWKVAVCMAVLLTGVANAANLISNGGFELMRADNASLPQDWFLVNLNSIEDNDTGIWDLANANLSEDFFGGAYSLGYANFASGFYFLKSKTIYNPEMTNNLWVFYFKNVTPSDGYSSFEILSFDGTNDSRDDFIVNFNETDVWEDQSAGNVEIAREQVENGWIKITVRQICPFTTGVDKLALYIWPNTATQGTFLLDNFSLEILQNPNISAGGNFSAYRNVSAIFNGSAVSSIGTVILYEWDFDGDGVFEWNSTVGGVANHTYAAAGTYNATLRATNNYNFSGTDNITVIVTAAPPIADAGNNLTVFAGETVTFSGSGYDPDGHVVLYEWDFDGNGIYDWNSTASGTTAFAYNSAGTYYAGLRVLDNDGMSATSSRKISVKSPPMPMQVIGGSTICSPSWSCTDWPECINGVQTRVCKDSNSCGTSRDKPPESQSCSLPSRPVENTNNQTANQTWVTGATAPATSGGTTITGLVFAAFSNPSVIVTVFFGAFLLLLAAIRKFSKVKRAKRTKKLI